VQPACFYMQAYCTGTLKTNHLAVPGGVTKGRTARAAISRGGKIEVMRGHQASHDFLGRHWRTISCTTRWDQFSEAL